MASFQGLCLFDFECNMWMKRGIFGLLHCTEKGKQPLEEIPFLNKVPGPRQILMKLSIISPPAIWGQIPVWFGNPGFLLWKKKIVFWGLSLERTSETLFFLGICEFTVGRFGGSRRFFSQLWRIMWTSELCMMLLGFLFGRRISMGIGRVVCVLNRDVKVRKSDDVFFFRWSLEKRGGTCQRDLQISTTRTTWWFNSYGRFLLPRSWTLKLLEMPWQQSSPGESKNSSMRVGPSRPHHEVSINSTFKHFQLR